MNLFVKGSETFLPRFGCPLMGTVKCFQYTPVNTKKPKENNYPPIRFYLNKVKSRNAQFKSFLYEEGDPEIDWKRAPNERGPGEEVDDNTTRQQKVH